MKLALDLILAAIVAMAVWNGYKKGLIMGIGGIVVLVVSVIIGSTLSTAYSQEVITAMRPFASGYTERLLTQSVYDTLGIEESEYSVEDLLTQNPQLGEKAAVGALEELGLSGDVAAAMAGEAAAKAKAGSESLSDSLTDVVCARVAFAVAFLLFFLLSVIILTVIGNITNLSFRIPYLGIGNEIGGALCGLVEGILFCLVAAWALRFMGILFPDGVLQETAILSRLMENNPLADYLGI